MENQVERLKLNVTNIKSYLINSNKQLRGLKVQRKNLFSKLEKQQTIRSKEKKLETKNLGIGSGFSNIVGAVTAPTRGIFDRILDFLGLVVLGILVQKLPAIISKINEFFDSDFIKAVKDIFGVIGTGFQKLGELINILTPQKQKELSDELKLIGSEADNDLKLADQADQDISQLEKELRDRENNNKSEPTPRVPMAPMAPGSMYPATTPQPPATKPQEPQKFSKGGTVQATNDQQTKPAYTPRKSGQLKRAERGMNNGFEDFSLAVDSINETTQRDEKNVLALAELSKNFREWSSLSGGPQKPGSPNQQGQNKKQTPGDDDSKQFSYESPTGDATIDIHSGQGRDASGEPGLDFSFRDYKNNYALFAGEVIDVPVYGGYGQSLRIRSKDPATGKMFDALYAHFPPNGVKVKIGDKVTPGQFLGPVGWDHKNGRPISGAGNMDGPHTSVDFFEPGTLRPYSNANGVTTSVINRKGKSPTIKPTQVVQPPKGIKLEPVSGDPISSGASSLLKALQRPGGGGGNRRLNNTNRSGNQSLFIYAVQPVETFVPFPYPIPMETPSSSTPQKSKVPPIWRA